MLLAIDVLAVILLLQGAAPLVQSALGTDPTESLFLVNSFADQQPFASLVLILLGVALLVLGRRLRARRR